MTASYDIPSEYKAYPGRLFSLRRTKRTPASNTKIFGDPSRQYYNTRETFGEAVLVLDESNAKVLVTTLLHTPLWIPKYYLHKEMGTTDDDFKKTNKLIDILLNNKIELSDKMRQEVAQHLRHLNGKGISRN